MPEKNGSPLPLRPQGRECGACSLCCKILPIEELEKPAGRWCEHFAPGVGCAIYSDRPHTCRAFRCGWLNGAGPEEARPDRAGFILHAPPDGSNGLCITFQKGRQTSELPPWLFAGVERLISQSIPVAISVEGLGGYLLDPRAHQ